MKLVDLNAELKEICTLSGEPTAKGKEMLARMEAERIERNKDIAGLIDERGRPTAAGLKRLCDDLYDVISLMRSGHDDNTGGSCRVDLDGHDCCYVCNAAEDMLRATAKYYEGR